MYVDIAFRVPLRWLFTALEVEGFREKVGDEAGFDEEVEAASSVGRGDDTGKFVTDAFGRDLSKKGGVFANGGPGVFFDFESSGGGKANGAKEAEGVFLKAFFGISDGTEDAGVEVGPSVDMVDDFSGEGILKESVDGEVAALGVFFG